MALMVDTTTRQCLLDTSLIGTKQRRTINEHRKMNDKSQTNALSLFCLTINVYIVWGLFCISNFFIGFYRLKKEQTNQTLSLASLRRKCE